MFGRLSATARLREHRAQERLRGALERSFTTLLSAEFNRVAQALAGAPATQRSGILAEHETRLLVLLRRQYGTIFQAFGGRARQLLPKKEDAKFEAAALRFMRKWSDKRSEEISKTTSRRLDRILAEATADGWHEDQTAAAIAERIGGALGTARARTIARTETHSASQDAGFEVAQDSGLKMLKQWVSVQDDRTREDHVEANDQVVPLEEAFKVGDDELQYPGDPTGLPEQIINCRCVCVYIPLA